MPVHNAGCFLETALESVLADLPDDAALVVVDDGSSDGSAALLRTRAEQDLRVTVLTNEEPRGVSAALNRAIEHGECPEFVAVAEHDDVTLPGRFAAQLDYLHGHPRCAAVSSEGQYLGPAGKVFGRVAVGPRDEAEQARWIDLGAPILVSHPAIMYRRSALDEVGLYDSAFDGAQDLDLVSRLAYSGWDVRRLPDVHFHYRLHDSATSFSKAAQQRDITRYIAYRNPRQRDGQWFDDFDTWRLSNSLTRWQRLDAARKDYGALLYRRGGLAWVSGQPAKAVLLAGASALVNPQWVLYKAKVLLGRT